MESRALLNTAQVVDLLNLDAVAELDVSWK